MSSTMAPEKFDSADRRAGVRRTVWIMALIALTIFVGFFLQQYFR